MLREYETQSTLNPELWDGECLKKGLHYKFLRIAKHFYDFLELPEDVRVLDVLLIGSNANYNWTDTSDIDLHVVIDYQAVGDNLHLVKNYMMAKKSIWNTNYPLTYKGMDVELYAQDWNERLHSSVGQYSLMRSKWIKKPNADIVSIDDEVIEAKAAPLEYEIHKLKDSDPQLEYKIKNILQRLYKMRQTGLEAEGEYSVENLAFKRLRNKGLLDRLKEMSKQITMTQLQLEESKLSKKYYLDQSKIHGTGAFANKSLGKGEVIGLLHTINELGIDYDFEELGRMYNHSDAPNCYNKKINNKRYLVTLHAIPRGEELTADYRLQPDLEQPTWQV